MSIVQGLLASYKSVASNPFANFVGGTVEDIKNSPTTALSSVQLATNGSVNFSGGNPPGSQSWYTPNTSGIGSSYWARVTIQSGTLSGSSGTGTWLAMSTSLSYTRNRTSIGSAQCGIRIEIASDSGGTNIVASADFLLYAEMA